MNRQLVGILGCMAVIIAAALAGAIVFAEKAIIDAGIPYHFVYYSSATVALCSLAVVAGLSSWRTRAGKVAFVGGAVVGVLMLGYVSLVFIAFSTPH